MISGLDRGRKERNADTFQFFAAREDTERLRLLADYTIARHFPELNEEDDRYLRLLGAVRDRQATLVAHWMSIGFDDSICVVSPYTGVSISGWNVPNSRSQMIRLAP